MRRNTIVALSVGGVLLGGAAVAAPASAGTAAAQVTVEVCAIGNYTAYAKLVQDDGALVSKLTRVPAGQCWTDHLQLNSSSGYKVWLFGIYNTSHKGFNVVSYGGQWPALTVPAANTYRQVKFWADGRTTSPSFAVSHS